MTALSSVAWQLALASFGDRRQGAVVTVGPLAHADTFVHQRRRGPDMDILDAGISTTTFLDRDHAVAVVRLPATRARAG